jgi:hypothetical protein
VQGAAGPPVVLSDAFDPDPEGAALSLTGAATAERSFSATGGDVRVDLRAFAGQAGMPLEVQVLDTKGHQVLAVGLGSSGHLPSNTPMAPSVLRKRPDGAI